MPVRPRCTAAAPARRPAPTLPPPERPHPREDRRGAEPCTPEREPEGRERRHHPGDQQRGAVEALRHGTPAAHRGTAPHLQRREHRGSHQRHRAARRWSLQRLVGLHVCRSGTGAPERDPGREPDAQHQHDQLGHGLQEHEHRHRRAHRGVPQRFMKAPARHEEQLQVVEQRAQRVEVQQQHHERIAPVAPRHRGGQHPAHRDAAHHRDPDARQRIGAAQLLGLGRVGPELGGHVDKHHRGIDGHGDEREIARQAQCLRLEGGRRHGGNTFAFHDAGRGLCGGVLRKGERIGWRRAPPVGSVRECGFAGLLWLGSDVDRLRADQPPLLHLLARMRHPAAHAAGREHAVKLSRPKPRASSSSAV
ncbi:hypothetical protein DdX_22161 [Ditylenchus destructor]|uniref:Uncharacterized protein n=1 Tax=Ditylenchus destructor TaxID=166010 RepID=A0AAD4QUN0_9BILA|nr:hypothetical protein DdX_22161 [Ditylenchus destructor]